MTSTLWGMAPNSEDFSAGRDLWKDRAFVMLVAEFASLGVRSPRNHAPNTPEGRIVMTREAAIQHRLYQSAMQGNVHAQIFLSRRIEQSRRDKADIVAKLDELVFRLKEEKREPTEAEALWIYQVRMLLHEVPRPKSAFVRTGKHRSHRKPKPKDGGSDPSKS